MEFDLDNRLQKLLGERKINLISPKGLLEISVATIEAVKAHLEEHHSNYRQWIDQLSDTAGILRMNR